MATVMPSNLVMTGIGTGPLDAEAAAVDAALAQAGAKLNGQRRLVAGGLMTRMQPPRIPAADDLAIIATREFVIEVVLKYFGNRAGPLDRLAPRPAVHARSHRHQPSV
jgi:hypothetical protein